MKAVTTHKSHKIVRLLPKDSDCMWPLHYIGYFRCFDQGLYYEAHDVLEELWLGCKNQQPYLFLKGLIQLAGAFVHIQKNRPAPAARLYELAWKNLNPYRPIYWGLDLQLLQDTLLPYHQLLIEKTQQPLTVLGAPLITSCLCPSPKNPQLHQG
jgi:predicted metal-dependent hydrolase